jgi:hypothetical protein
LIRSGERYHLGKDNTVLCPVCVCNLLIGEDFDTIEATDHVAVDYGGGVVRLRREGAAIVVAPREVRHLVDALVEAGVRMAENRRKGGAQPCDPSAEPA